MKFEEQNFCVLWCDKNLIWHDILICFLLKIYWMTSFTCVKCLSKNVFIRLPHLCCLVGEDSISLGEKGGSISPLDTSYEKVSGSLDVLYNYIVIIFFPVLLQLLREKDLWYNTIKIVIYNFQTIKKRFSKVGISE
jgi:hypothetical protein